jgi:hypothetical protein
MPSRWWSCGYRGQFRRARRSRALISTIRPGTIEIYQGRTVTERIFVVWRPRGSHPGRAAPVARRRGDGSRMFARDARRSKRNCRRLRAICRACANQVARASGTDRERLLTELRRLERSRALPAPSSRPSQISAADARFALWQTKAKRRAALQPRRRASLDRDVFVRRCIRAAAEFAEALLVRGRSTTFHGTASIRAGSIPSWSVSSRRRVSSSSSGGAYAQSPLPGLRRRSRIPGNARARWARRKSSTAVLWPNGRSSPTELRFRFRPLRGSRRGTRSISTAIGRGAARARGR